MAYWLYQIDAKTWSPERYRTEVWEGTVTTHWKVGTIEPPGGKPQPGEILILFYLEANTTDPGIYGWGIVTRCEGEDIHFRPVSPGDYLKVNPAWNESVGNIIERIRGEMKMGTMWEIDLNSMHDLRKEISNSVCTLHGKVREYFRGIDI